MTALPTDTAIGYARQHGHDCCPGWAVITYEPPETTLNYPPLAMRLHFGMPEPTSGETALGLYDSNITVNLAVDADGKQAANGSGATHVTVAAGIGFVLLTDQRLCGSMLAAQYLGGKIDLNESRVAVFSIPLSSISDITAEISRKALRRPTVDSACAYNCGTTFGGVHCSVREEIRKQPREQPTATRKVDSSALLIALAQATARQRLDQRPDDSQANDWRNLSRFDVTNRILPPGLHLPIENVARADAARQAFLRDVGREFRSL